MASTQPKSNTSGDWRQHAPVPIPGSHGPDSFGGRTGHRERGGGGGFRRGAGSGPKRYNPLSVSESTPSVNDELLRHSPSSSTPITTPAHSPPEYKASLAAVCDKIKAATAALSQINNSHKGRTNAPPRGSFSSTVSTGCSVFDFKQRPDSTPAAKPAAPPAPSEIPSWGAPLEQPLGHPPPLSTSHLSDQPSKHFNWADGDSGDDVVIPCLRAPESPPAKLNWADLDDEDDLVAPMVFQNGPSAQNAPPAIPERQPEKKPWADVEDKGNIRVALPRPALPSVFNSSQPELAAKSTDQPPVHVNAESGSNSLHPKTFLITPVSSTKIDKEAGPPCVAIPAKYQPPSRRRTANSGWEDPKAKEGGRYRDHNSRTRNGNHAQDRRGSHGSSFTREGSRPRDTNNVREGRQPPGGDHVQECNRFRAQSNARSASTARTANRHRRPSATCRPSVNSAVPSLLQPSSTTISPPLPTSSSVNGDLDDLTFRLNETLKMAEKKEVSVPAEKSETVASAGHNRPGSRKEPVRNAFGSRKPLSVGAEDEKEKEFRGGLPRRAVGTDGEFGRRSSKSKGAVGNNHASPAGSSIHPAEVLRTFRPSRPEQDQGSFGTPKARSTNSSSNTTAMHLGPDERTTEPARTRPRVNLGVAQRLLMRDLGLQAKREPRPKADAKGLVHKDDKEMRAGHKSGIDRGSEEISFKGAAKAAGRVG